MKPSASSHRGASDTHRGASNAQERGLLYPREWPLTPVEGPPIFIEESSMPKEGPPVSAEGPLHIPTEGLL